VAEEVLAVFVCRILVILPHYSHEDHLGVHVGTFQFDQVLLLLVVLLVLTLQLASRALVVRDHAAVFGLEELLLRLVVNDFAEVVVGPNQIVVEELCSCLSLLS